MDNAIAGPLAGGAGERRTRRAAELLGLFRQPPGRPSTHGSCWSQRLVDPDSSIEAEQLLLRLARGGDPQRERAATARLAALLEFGSVGTTRPPISTDASAEQWASLVCLDGKTGAQLIAALPEKSEVRRLLAPSQAWPVGQVQKSRSARSGHLEYPLLSRESVRVTWSRSIRTPASSSSISSSRSSARTVSAATAGESRSMSPTRPARSTSIRSPATAA